MASNWSDWSSFVGNNYAFRPYFQDAVRQSSGRYFAVGVTTGIPGYFLSHAVRDDNGVVLGVLVVKLELEELQREWAGQSGVFLVADSHSVVILNRRNFLPPSIVTAARRCSISTPSTTVVPTTELAMPFVDQPAGLERSELTCGCTTRSGSPVRTE